MNKIRIPSPLLLLLLAIIILNQHILADHIAFQQPQWISKRHTLFRLPPPMIQRMENDVVVSATTSVYSNNRRWYLTMAKRNENESNDIIDQKSSSTMEDTEYKNVATKLLSNFMSANTKTSNSNTNINTETDTSVDTDPLSTIDFNAPKFNMKRSSIQQLADILDYELSESEWFVTGKVNPIYFSDNFQFQDPDVSLNGIEQYARGVNKLFDQETSRAQIISTVVSADNMITCTWRLSGKVKIGPGLTIKPYIVYTDFTVNTDDDGLIVFQEDRFDIPQWDILLSALFPFLIGVITSPPAPPVEPRIIKVPGSTKVTSGNFFLLPSFLTSNFSKK